MSDEDLKKYLPTEETFRRVADRAASDENMRRALSRVEAARASAAEPLGPAARVPLVRAEARPEVRRKAPGRPGRWRLLGWIAGAAVAVSAPALLIYWLFVPRDVSSGTVEASATSAPGAPVVPSSAAELAAPPLPSGAAESAAPPLPSSAPASAAPLPSSSAPVPLPVAGASGAPSGSSAATRAIAAPAPSALPSAAPAPSGGPTPSDARRAPARGANAVAAPGDPGQRMPPPRTTAAAPATSMPGPFAGPPRY